MTTIEDQAFAEKGLSSVIIPNSVITIGSAAFVMNQLTSVNIPNSVTEISDAAFDRNQLTSLTLGNSITSIGSIAFIGNNLTSVIIPDSVITIEPMAFAVNSSYANGSMGMFSDPGQAQVLYDAIRLVKLYTEDPSNPNNLQDDTVTEAELLGGQDFNQNGNTDDILGGHVINPPVEESGSNQAELTSPVSSQPVLLTTPTGTNLVSTTASKESSLSVTDPAYDYPSGLVGFTFTTAETDNQVSLTFVTDKTPSQVVPRKYNPTTNAYFNIPNASITETTYNNQHALQLTYTITDNGDLDLDPTIGTITDPVGLATITTDSPNTGISHWLLAVKQ